MNKSLLVLKHEVYSLVSRFSFWFGVLGIPLLGLVVLTVVNYINRSQGAGGESATPFAQVGEAFSQEEDTRPQGFVDLSGIVQEYPQDFNGMDLLRYESESDAQKDMDSGKIGGFYVISKDYLKTGQVIVYTEQYNLINAEDRSAPLTQLLAFNLLGGDQALVNAVRNPIADLESVSTIPVTEENAPVAPRDRESMTYFFLPYGIMMLFYIAILGSAGLMLNSVAKEKENRIMEVLLLSTNPIRLLLGKIVGLGLVGLLQVVIWLVSSLALLTLSGQTIPALAGVRIPPGMIVWGIVFFVLGYLVYASLMAGVGALVPNLREASQATMIVILPLMIPLFIISALIETPNSPISVGMSLFPLTAPTTMMLRMAATNVPFWQPLLAAALLVVTDILVMRAVAGMFRAQTLLSGQPFKVKKFFLALVGKG